jgi:CubicO group peptidase (beta-lactamase class C family)
MNQHRLLLLVAFLAAQLSAQTLLAAPDEDALGKAAGYPAGRDLKQAYEEAYRVGSFSAMDSIAPSCSLAPADTPVPLERTPAEPTFTYRFQGRSFTLDDYLQRQRATGVLIVHDGRVVAERYSYARTPEMRMLSNSIAKTITALGVLKAQEEGLIQSLNDLAEDYVPALKGSLYGRTQLIHLLRMASGARYVEDYSGRDDHARFNATARRSGNLAAMHQVVERADPGGERFNYAGAQTQVLGLVLRAASGRTLCDYIGEKIWRPLGAESRATWLLNPIDQVEIAQGGFNATVRDYARLGMLLAADGQAGGRAVVTREHVLDMTDPARQPEAFRPGRMQYRGSTYQGYGLQTWLLPGSHRRFALLGVYGQAIYVDPLLKLVVVHTAVGKDASGNASGNHLGAERDALLRGIVAQYGDW